MNKSNLQIFRELENAVLSQEFIKDFKNFDDLMIDGKSIRSFFSGIYRSKKKTRVSPYSDHKIFDEFSILTKDIQYYISFLNYLKPYINNSTTNGTYIQTIEDSRYMMYASTTYQAIYCFWDRIGDIIDMFFDTGLQKNKIYISSVLNNFPKQYRTSPNYLHVSDIYNNKLKKLIIERNDVVHTYSLECEFYWKIMEARAIGDFDEISEIQKVKYSFPELFKTQLGFIYDGFETAMKLIDELPNIKVK